jgi:serine protease
VATVDEPGPGAPAVVRFTARNHQEKDAQVRSLGQRGDVLTVEHEKKVVALDTQVTTDDASYSLQWAPAKANFVAEWNTAPDFFNGTGQTIAIVDSGVQASHEDLGTTKVLAGIDELGVYANGRTDPEGHGTHVAGIAAAADNAVGIVGGAPGATILPVRVLNSCGLGSTGLVAAGIRYAADHGATVINLSLGSPDYSQAIQDEISYANGIGVTVVAAAGNCGQGATPSACPSGVDTPLYPAASNGNTIGVAATDSNDAKAPYSNGGSYVDVAAPGGTGNQVTTSIVSTYNTADNAYALLNGTSMSTPLVSAAAALVRERCPALTTAQILAAIHDFAAGAPISGLPAGVGRLDASASVTNAC